jgi:hypothetical protein
MPELDRLRAFIEALRVLAQGNDPNRVVSIENAIDEYLKGEPGNVRLALERLCDAIEREEAEMRRNEDWIITTGGDDPSHGPLALAGQRAGSGTQD